MDLTKALAPKSDQLDFADLDGIAPQVFTITAVSENGSELSDQQPVNDLIEHEDSDACVCIPEIEPVPHDDGSMGWLVTHHALDGRG